MKKPWMAVCATMIAILLLPACVSLKDWDENQTTTEDLAQDGINNTQTETVDTLDFATEDTIETTDVVKFEEEECETTHATEILATYPADLPTENKNSQRPIAPPVTEPEEIEPPTQDTDGQFGGFEEE